MLICLTIHIYRKKKIEKKKLKMPTFKLPQIFNLVDSKKESKNNQMHQILHFQPCIANIHVPEALRPYNGKN